MEIERETERESERERIEKNGRNRGSGKEGTLSNTATSGVPSLGCIAQYFEHFLS